MFYLHIPKTGGQTLAARLASAFPPGRAHLQPDQYTYPQGIETLRRDLAAFDFVEGHVTGELLSEVSADDILVTFREPVAQIISNYRHIRRETGRPLARAAQELSPAAFFDHFGDFFIDFQSRYLLSSFIPIDLLSQREGWWSCLAQHLPETMRRIRWLVPTDRIDAFIPLWETETGRKVAEQTLEVNRAPPDGVDLAELEQVIRARPQLFALDNLVYQYVCSAFSGWASGIEAQLHPWNYPENASRIWFEADCGIWLRQGWYPVEATRRGLGNWAGPNRASEIEVLRRPGQDWLIFELLVVNGITYADINVFARDGFVELPVIRREIEPGRWRYAVDLGALPLATGITLTVPDCFAPINVFPAGEDGGLERRSFLAAGWQLAQAEDEVPAANAGAATLPLVDPACPPAAQ